VAFSVIYNVVFADGPLGDDIFRSRGSKSRKPAKRTASIPVPLIGKIAELLLKRQNDREWEAVLANIKARVEAETLATVD
jgi:hypothetical protein